MLLIRYSLQLYEMPLPKDTIKISQNKAVGNLYGTGNHLDFVATIEVETSLSEDELITYYNNEVKKIKSVDEISIFGLNTFYAETNIDHSIQTIEVIPKSLAKSVYGTSKIYMKEKALDQNPSDNHFIIQIKDTHYAAGLDIRAH